MYADLSDDCARRAGRNRDRRQLPRVFLHDRWRLGWRSSRSIASRDLNARAAFLHLSGPTVAQHAALAALTPRERCVCWNPWREEFKRATRLVRAGARACRACSAGLPGGVLCVRRLLALRRLAELALGLWIGKAVAATPGATSVPTGRVISVRFAYTRGLADSRKPRRAFSATAAASCSRRAALRARRAVLCARQAAFQARTLGKHLCPCRATRTHPPRPGSICSAALRLTGAAQVLAQDLRSGPDTLTSGLAGSALSPPCPESLSWWYWHHLHQPFFAPEDAFGRAGLNLDPIATHREDQQRDPPGARRRRDKRSRRCPCDRLLGDSGSASR